MTPSLPSPRQERRRQSQTQILAAAQRLFADQGFEKTTIRTVAAAASVDPALVMQYFGSKDSLFAACSRWAVEKPRLAGSDASEVTRNVLDVLLCDFEDEQARGAGLALLRSCLTNADAMERMREDILAQAQAEIAAVVSSADAELRASLVLSVLVGVILGRHMFRVPGMESASIDELEALLQPLILAVLAE